MAIIIEKVAAGEDAAKSQEEFAAATIAATNAPSKEYLEAREARAREEAEMNLSTNALIFPLPGETIATRVVVVSDEEAKNVENGSRVVDQAAFIDAAVEAAQPNVVPTATVAEGETEDVVDHTSTPEGHANTSPAGSVSVPGSGTGNRHFEQ